MTVKSCLQEPKRIYYNLFFAYHYLAFKFAAISCEYIAASSVSLHCLLYAFPTGYFVRKLHLLVVSLLTSILLSS